MMTQTVAYDDDNIFAKILAGSMPCHKIYEDEDTFAFMDIMPRSKGHCLVIPKSRARNILDVELDDLAKVMATVQKLSRAVLQAFDADGVSIQQANEAAGGQVVFHLHVHIIPRFDGIKMGPPASTMEEPDVLKENAEKIRQALAE
ncbi:HIT family protein [Hoeflea sp.]|uniref:HIT family protein n=1 Tax=Hoeflea sp. TaxID=1940281 RepID=UPI003B02AE71